MYMDVYVYMYVYMYVNGTSGMKNYTNIWELYQRAKNDTTDTTNNSLISIDFHTFE